MFTKIVNVYEGKLGLVDYDDLRNKHFVKDRKCFMEISCKLCIFSRSEVPCCPTLEHMGQRFLRLFNLVNQVYNTYGGISKSCYTWVLEL